MNDSLTFPLKRLSSASNSEDSLRVIVFPVSNYLFALPVGAVIKIINSPPLTNKFENGIGMVNLGSQTYTVLDLSHNFLENSSEKIVTNTDNFANKQIDLLILIQTKNDENCAIKIARSPVLMDIPLTTIRPIPSSYRQVANLNFVTHMAVLSSEEEEKETVNVFLLATNEIFGNSRSSN